jgi:hypothetical protein
MRNGEAFYLGLAVSQLDEKQAIPFLNPNKERLLEYDLSRAIARVANPEKPTIAIMSPLPVFGGPANPMMMQMGRGGAGTPPWVIVNELKNDFNVKHVEMDTGLIDNDIKVLVVIHPRDITDKAQYAIDQFVMRGGKLIAFLDPLPLADQKEQNQMLGSIPNSGSNLDKLLKAWGITFDTGKVVADMKYKMQVGGRNGQPQDAPAFLSPHERRILNQIRGHAYLNIFGLVEEFILPFVMDHVRPGLAADDWRTRALLQFAGEEAKHSQLFKRFRDAFEVGFGHKCGMIGPPQAVAEHVLSHDPLGVALVILHIEWMTQRHYLDSVRSDEGLDPLFKSLLRHHWMEEAQHARLDALMVEALAEGKSQEELVRGVDAYLAIGTFLDQGLLQQVDLDLDALERATGRKLGLAERAGLRESQHQANRWTYLGSGMSHPEFLTTVGKLSPAQRARLEGVAPAFS